MDSSLLVAVAIGFGAGSFGYVLMRFYVSPVLAYRKLKARTRSTLERIEGGCSEGTVSRKVVPEIDGLRFLAKDVMGCHEELLPMWFRLSLVRKGEDPMEAASGMMAASNIRNGAHLKKRIAAIRKAFGLV